MSRDLQAAQAVVARAAGGPLSVWQRSQLRAHVRAYEAQAGESLVAAAERLLAAGDRAGCARLLDMLDALHGG